MAGIFAIPAILCERGGSEAPIGGAAGTPGMVTARHLGLMHGVAEYAVSGTLSDGRVVSGILCEGEEPGHFWWEPDGGDHPGLVEHRPVGVVPGDPATGWSEVEEALGNSVIA